MPPNDFHEDEVVEQLSLFPAQRGTSQPRTPPPSFTLPPYATDGNPFSDITGLERLAEIAAGCRRCGLRDGCRGVVFGEGDPLARVMLVGEGPGATEDEQGRPFVGKAGQLLNRILEAVEFQRESVYITNVVKCRPPGNRAPTEEEMRTCFAYLEAQVRLLRPAILVGLGSTAVKALIDPRARITRIRGTWHERWGVPVMPTFHPAALLRDPSKKRPVWEDFKAIRARYEAICSS